MEGLSESPRGNKSLTFAWNCKISVIEKTRSSSILIQLYRLLDLLAHSCKFAGPDQKGEQSRLVVCLPLIDEEMLYANIRNPINQAAGAQFFTSSQVKKKVNFFFLFHLDGFFGIWACFWRRENLNNRVIKCCWMTKRGESDASPQRLCCSSMSRVIWNHTHTEPGWALAGRAASAGAEVRGQGNGGECTWRGRAGSAWSRKIKAFFFVSVFGDLRKQNRLMGLSYCCWIMAPLPFAKPSVTNHGNRVKVQAKQRHLNPTAKPQTSDAGS